MPTYQVTSPTGRVVRITGDKPPSEDQLNTIFQSIPQQTAPQPQEDQGIISKIGTGVGKFFNENPLGKGLVDIMQGLEYPIGGYLSGTYKKSQELAPQVQSGQMGKPEAVLRSLSSGLGGIIPGIQNRTSISNYLDQVKELNPAQKLAVGLLASLAVPSVPVGKIFKTLGVTDKIKDVAKAAGEIPFTLGKYRTKLGELVVPRYGQPNEYVKMVKEAEGLIEKATEKGVKIARPISKMSSEAQTLIGKAIRGEVPMTSDIEKVTKPAMEEFQMWGEEAVKEGLLPKDIFSKFGPLFEGTTENVANKGYLPRLYRMFEDTTNKGKEVLEKFTGYKPSRLDLSRFMERTDIPEDVRKAMGEITEAGYPTAKGISQLAETVTKTKLYRKIAENTEWVSDTIKDGFTRLPKTERLGTLSEKYVLDPIAHDIEESIKIKVPIEQLANKVTSWWKYGKVVLNPATHVRNMLSNVVQAYTNAGLSPTRVDVYGSALTDLAKKSGDFQEAKDLGLMGSTYYGNEIKQMLDGFKKGNGIMDFAKEKIKGLGNLYQAEEQWFKLAVFKHQKELGKTAEEAAKVAQDSLFDYSEVPNSIKFLRETVVGFPFLTFAYKAMPKAVESFIQNPSRFANIRRISQAIEGLNNKEETKAEVSNFPNWMKEKSKEFLKIPVKDQYGRSQYIDMSYIYPWYSYGGIQPGSHPAISITTSVMKNKDFLGNEIYKTTDTEEEKNIKVAKYVFQQLAPSLVGGYGYDKLVKAAKQTPDYMGRVPNVPATILDTLFGIKAQPFDLKEQQMWRRKEDEKKLQDLQSEFKGMMRNVGLTPEEKEKAKQNFIQKRTKVIEEMRNR